MIERVIITVSDKSGLRELLEGLYDHNPDIKIISSSGTARRIDELGFKARRIDEYTGMKESPGGLVKTLHPKIHGGILLHEDIPEHKEYMNRNGIEHIDGVVVNFYQFGDVAKSTDDPEELLEYIDIGGPSIARAAAKASYMYRNMKRKKFVLDNPKYYRQFLQQVDNLSKEFVVKMANEVFHKTSGYDYQIWKHLRDVL